MEQTTQTTRSPRDRRTLMWVATLTPLAVLVIWISVTAGRTVDSLELGSAAPAFSLTGTDGGVVTLDDVISDGSALLYFSMGPGCAGCFAQIPEIEERLADRGIRLVPIMVASASVVSAEAQRFDIETPILIDSDRSVAEAYEMLGVYGHVNTPSHSFALVDTEGRLTWVGHFAEMYLPFDVLWGHIENDAI